MAESEAGGSVGQEASERAIASVTDAVRVATEASLAPVTKSTSRREAKAAMQPTAVRAALPQQPFKSPELPETPLKVKTAAVSVPEAELPPPESVVMVPPVEPTHATRSDPAPAVAESVLAVPDTMPTPRTMETIMTTAEELMSFQQGNFEAMLKSSQIWATGLQDLGRNWAASAQAQMDETLGTVKALTAVKSLREAVELQSTLARSSMEKVVAEGGKITDATMKLAEQTLAPITARLNIAAERFGRSAT